MGGEREREKEGGRMRGGKEEDGEADPAAHVRRKATRSLRCGEVLHTVLGHGGVQEAKVGPARAAEDVAVQRRRRYPESRVHMAGWGPTGSTEGVQAGRACVRHAAQARTNGTQGLHASGGDVGRYADRGIA